MPACLILEPGRNRSFLFFFGGPAIVPLIPIGLGVCEEIGNIALTLRVLGGHIFKTTQETARKEDRGFLYDAVVNRFEKYI